MLTHPTLDQLRALRLDGMADAFVELQSQDNARDLSHAEWLALLLDREAAKRDTSRFQTRLRSAKLRHSQASIEDVDYRAARRLDKAMFQQLATGRWIAEHRNVLVTGKCGVGKSWLSCALAQKACRDGYTVHYARVPRLFAELELAHGDGRFARLFRMLIKADLLGTRVDSFYRKPERKGVLRDLARVHLPRGVANRTKLGFGFDVRRYLHGAARPDFLADGRLRDALAVPADEWRTAVAQPSSAHALRLWTGEVWCRLFLDGEDEAAVEAALWR